jgi:hypothetical protein
MLHPHLEQKLSTDLSDIYTSYLIDKNELIYQSQRFIYPFFDIIQLGN